MTNKNPPKAPFKKGKDDRRHAAPNGNNYAKGPHKTGRNFITQQLIATLNEVVKDPTTQEEKTKIAISVDQLVAKMMTGDLAAFAYACDRIEGKPTQNVAGKMEHQHRLDVLLPELSDKELDVLERISRKALELDGVKLIEAQPLK